MWYKKGGFLDQSTNFYNMAMKPGTYADNLQALEKYGIVILNRPRKHPVKETPETESPPDKPVKAKKKSRKTAVKKNN